jgi:hypothetical protein
MSNRTLALRSQLWPDLDESDLWLRTKSKGFTTIPRTMPLILDIMDDLAGKGKPVSKAYLGLWCRVFDEGMLELKSYEDLASESGFTGQRSMHTWKQRMSILVKLGFIKAELGPRGEYDFVLLLNPDHVIKSYYSDGKVQKAKYNSFFARAQDVGAEDLSI